MSNLAPLTLDALRVGVMLLGPQDEVAYANPAADQLGLIEREPEGNAVAHSVLRSLAARTRRRNVPDDLELELPQGVGRDPLGVRVRLVALDDHVAIEAEDITAAHRLARVRRDFVANVSHELKTPVGALQLVSEALLEATDSIQEDESAVVRRFVERILHESTRMGRLVAELLELSRLEGGGPQPDPEPVALERVFLEVLDRTRTAAAARQITVRVDGRPQSQMRGNEGLLLTAVS
ncbi:MAG: sensor histidine kinase, partial [Micromonosporaceae bacterium]